MQAGTLTEDIQILRPTVTKDKYGAEKKTYSIVEECKAKADYIVGGAGRGESNQEIVYNTIYIFTTYYHVDVKPYDRIVYNDQTYNVVYVKPNRIQNNKQINCEIIND